MKKPLLLLILSCLGIYCSYAQGIEATYENSFEANISYVFENLDFSDVTTNLLVDRSIPFVEVDSFDGVQLMPYNKLDINRFGLLYATMYGSILDTTAMLPHPDAYMAVVDSLQFGDDVPIAIFHYDYHRFKKYALDSNLLVVQDSQLHDVPNRPESPYLSKKAWGITPLLTYMDTLDITFSLPDSLVFSNTTGVALFEIDLDDGNGYQTLGFNQTITASYEEEGEKELLFKVTLVDSTVHYGHAAIYARGTGVNSNFQKGGSLNKDYSLSPDTTIAIEATADHEAGELQVLFGCTGLRMRKPLLYVQGYIPKIGKAKNNPQDYQYMMGDNRFGQFLPGGSDQITDVLELEGYDLIFLKLDHSGDYVERNAEIVKKAIRKINEMKKENGSEEELIVIGASAGGISGKYALLQMEQAGEDHEVKTFISLDAPFRGANLSVGAQFMVLHLLNTELGFLGGTVNLGLGLFVKQVKDLEAVTHDGFIQNLAIYNILEEPAFFGPLPNNFSGGDMTRQTFTNFMNELGSMGELQHCDFVALSNGSAIQEGQGFNPGDKLLEAKGGTSELLKELDGVGSFLSEVLATVGWLFATGVRFDLNVYALPDNPSSYEKVYEGKTKIFITGWIPVEWTNYKGKVKETVPYDNAPGGTAPISRDSLPGFVTVFHENICLVPTVSGLDITSPENEDLFQDLSDVDSVTGIGLSLTDRYDASIDTSFGGAHNQKHASLNSTNIPFLMAELASGDSLQSLPVNANGELVLGDRTYNYGDAAGHFDPANPTIRHTPNQLKDTLWVENTGVLWVNRDDKISFTDEPNNPVNTTNSHFDLFIQGQDGCVLNDVELHVENGGNMTIGDISISNTADVNVMDGSKVFVRNAGNLSLEDESHFIVESGGEVYLGSGGIFQAFGDAAVYVREGGIFRVEAGGILKMFNDAKLLVEPGGQLILEDGAVVQLYDQYQQEAEATIHIQGELVINGDFDFWGNGFFQFDAGNVLTLANGSEFKLDGEGKGTRFLRMNQLALLKIGGSTIRLTDGEVTYESSSSIGLGTDGRAVLINVEFTDLNPSGAANALLALASPKVITASNCTFNNLVKGIEARNITGEPLIGDYIRYFYISNCEFIDCHAAVYVEDTPYVGIDNSDFTTSSSLSLYGLDLTSVGNAKVYNSNFSGYSDGLWAAVHLDDVPDYNMVSGTVNGNARGIWATGQSNIDMTSGATVASNVIGIEMEGGSSFGVLTMDCAKLLDNGTGVLGDDVTLNIDASGELKPNHYRTVTGSPLFDICYGQLTGIIGDEIDAKDNFWEGDIYYRIYNPSLPYSSGCGYVYGDVTLIIDPQAPDPSCGSPNGPSNPNNTAPFPHTPAHYFTGDDPNCEDNHQLTLYDTYWDAYDAYLQETHNGASDRALSDSLFFEIASIPDSLGQSYILKCQQLIHFARSRVDSLSSPLNYIHDGKNQAENRILPKREGLIVFPNPAKNEVTVRLRPGHYDLRVFNAYGVQVFKTIASADVRIEIEDWPQGLYFVEVMDVLKKEKNGVKVIIN